MYQFTKKSKVLALVLAAIMVFSTIHVSVRAENDESVPATNVEQTETVDTGENTPAEEAEEVLAADDVTKNPDGQEPSAQEEPAGEDQTAQPAEDKSESESANEEPADIPEISDVDPAKEAEGTAQPAEEVADPEVITPAEEPAEEGEKQGEAEAPVEQPDEAENGEPVEEVPEAEPVEEEPAEEAGEVPAAEPEKQEEAEAPAEETPTEAEVPAEPVEGAADSEVITPAEESEEPAVEDPSEVSEEQPAEVIEEPASSETEDPAEAPAEEVKPVEEAPEEKQGMKVNVSTTWDDMDNLDGIRPDYIEVQLLTGEVPTEGVKTLILNEANGWAGYWEGIPEKDENGQRILYRVKVVETAVMAGRDGLKTYISKFFGNAQDGFTIKNEHLGPSYYVPENGTASRGLVKKAAQIVLRAAGDVPAHDKNLTTNDDGTYTIALNVTGDSEKKIQKINVIVIVDRSGSMGEQSGTDAYVPSNQNGSDMYGLIDGAYVRLTRVNIGSYYNPRYAYYYNDVQYTGQRYQHDTEATRMQATQSAVDSLARTLLGYNGANGNPDDTVQMALVSFATTAQTDVDPTTSANTFSTAVANLTANGGTNWEDGLQEAYGINFGDDDQTFVIFFSDGAPTFHSSNGGYNNWNQRYGVYGTGQEDATNMQHSYDQAVDDAASLATKVGPGRFYTIFAYGSNAGQTYMTNLTTAAGAPAGNNYSASSTAALNDAFAAILESIEMAGIGDVGITDGTTSNVETTSGAISHLLDVDPNSFKYYRAGGTDTNGNEKYDSNANGGLGVEWADAPTAIFEGGAVKWSIEGVLENDVTYTVTFDCWPSQTTLDIVADIKNDPSSYDKLDANIQNYIDREGKLKTNTAATLSYTDTRTNESGSSAFENPKPVSTTAVEQLAISKKWENELDGHEAAPITLTVTSDSTAHHTLTLSNANGWTGSTYISIGIMRTHGSDPVELLTTGHNFTFTEPKDLGYYWELNVPTVRPMIVDGTLKLLVKVDEKHPAPTGATVYTLPAKDSVAGGQYYVDEKTEAALTAINERRSVLDIKKVVDGEDADPEQEFRFTVNVVNSKAAEGSESDLNSDYWVWFSVWNGDYVDALVSGATKEMKDGKWTGYYYAPSGTDVVVNLKVGDGLRFINLPTDSTYTITEGTLPDNYAFTSSVLTSGTDSTFKGAQTTTGTIKETNTNYLVTYTNTYALTDIEITKVWDDNGNQDGIRLTAEAFKAKLVLKADGTDVTAANADKLTVKVDPENANQYIVKWTGLDRYADGEEITYTVEETAIEGYTTKGSPANDKGTITNTHTPETTSVTVIKVWEDSNNIGNIRPASINVQLTADGTASGDPVTLNADNQWTYTWENLPKYKDGTKIVYSADETAVPAGYTKTGPVEAPAEDGTVTFTVTNTYNPTPVVVDPPVQKIITGNDNLYNKGDFTFTIAAVSPADAPMPTNTSVTNSKEYELEGKIGFYEFGNITFTMPGTYTYKVTESGSVDGVTNDSAAAEGKTITFTVTDDGTGNLVVTPTTDQIQISFTNVYNAEGEASIVVNKAVSGAAWPTDKTLTLTIAGVDGAPMPAKTTAELTAAGSATFGPIKYALTDAGKTFTYTITEDGFGTGWTGSGDITATVVVTDNGNGTLSTTVTYSPEGATITNTYKATGTAEIEVTKALSGAAWPANKTLAFTLTGTNNAPMPKVTQVILTAEGTVKFGPIDYTEADAGKTYTYTITEDGFGDGWSGSGDITATVVVTDNGNGTLNTTVTYSPENKTITNTYKATGTAVLEATKAIEGAAWPKDATITFTLSGTGGTLPETKTVTLSEAGKATFGAITYTEADAGKTYTYTITEDGFGDGWSGSGDITATVKVTDNGDGTLKTEITYSPENKTITNTYKATGTAVLEATKAIEGAAWPKDATITFTLSGEGGTLPETVTVELTEAGKATFGAITYTEADAGKTYTYTITEDGFGKGWSGSGDITATVKVTDNGDGTLKTEITYSPENKTITNTYKATGTAVLEATKAIEGAAWPKDATITFTLSGEGGTLPETVTVELTEAGKATFGAIKYTEADAGQTYTYTISEDGFGDGWTGSGSITATVKVTDNGDGTLKTEVTYSPENKTITNTYKATGTAVLEATKAIEGAAWPTGKTITFTLSGEGGTLPETVTVELTEAGKATFGAIKYTEADAGQTYTYTITENGFGTGWTGSGSITATVVVTDNGDGTLKTEVTYSPEDATITNTYKAKGEMELFAGKKLVAEEGLNAPDVSGKYTLTLEGQDGAPMPEGSINGKAVIKNADGDGTMTTFGKITFTEAHAGKTYTYKVTETGTVAGVTNGTSEYTVTVTVKDNGDGTLTVTATPNAETLFTNTYSVKPTTSEFSVEKILKVPEGLEGPADWSFDIKVEAMDGAPEAEVMSGTITSEKPVLTFSGFTFSKPGTYIYKVTESGEVAGVTNDEAAVAGLRVSITVVDNGDGKLTATASSTKEKPLVITNTYSVEPVTASIPVQKLFEVPEQWKDLSDFKGLFTFTLTAEDGTPLPEVVSYTNPDKDGGLVVFGDIEFVLPGTYTYTVTETGTVKGVENDKESAKTVTITVTDNQDGTLSAEVSVSEEKPLTFKNTVTLVDLTVVKKWEDSQNQDGKRPEQIVVTLFADGKAIDEVNLNEANKWTYTFKDLPEFKDQTAIVYTVEEAAVEGYTPSYEGLTITNTHPAEKVKVSVSKVWNDKDDVDGVRPESISVQLLADGVAFGEAVKLDEAGKWAYTWEKLDKYKAGKQIIYTIKEIEVPEYTAELKSETDKDGNVTVTLTNTHITYAKDDPPVLKELTGDKPEKEEAFSFKLKAISNTAGLETLPMPEGATGQEMTITAMPGVKTEFGWITFTKEGTYVYEISEVNTGLKNYTYDTTVYTLTYHITKKDTSLVKELIITVDGKETDKAVYTFTNNYKKEKPPTPPETPDTGDHSNLGLWAATTAVSFVGAMFMVLAIRRKKEEEV